jgi:NADH:ubiquinone oxidoreductase subunit F (NADH-binding)
LAGKIARGGLIEVPMGITVREIIEEIGGGVANGKTFKAVQIGGPSGGCVPHWLADTPVDYESLTGVGAMMGSGGMVVLDDTDCMVDIARYFLSFTQNESCGKCTFCRVGTKRMLDILNKICSGKGKPSDLDDLEKLAEWTKKGSLCGLGKTAPNPVLSTLKYFRNEYEDHINGKCPTGKCKDMVQYFITDKCIGCTKCVQSCPVDAIAFQPHEQHVIDTEKCIKCDACRAICPVDAVITQ